MENPAISSSQRTKVTSVDVAAKAGVSQATVSLVFSGKASGRVSERTAEAVRQAARELGYRPNVAARALRSGAARVIGLLVPDSVHPFFGFVLRGAQRAAWDAGYTVAQIDTGRGAAWEAGSAEALIHGPVDGFLVFGIDLPSALTGPGSLPVVLVERASSKIASVRFDVEGGMQASLEHLTALGHTRIAHMRGDYDQETFARRRATWEKFVADPKKLPSIPTVLRVEAAIDAAHELFEHPAKATAVVCDDDIAAAGLYVAARQAGIRIPQDLSVVGFDDLEISRVLDPPLTTVRIDGEALGAEAIKVLLARLEGRRARRETVLPVELVERASTAPPA
ncbi:MAG TPA: LacI family DNA-binding transcriptional regulator [Solirubrobacteraceae bacterium]